MEHISTILDGVMEKHGMRKCTVRCAWCGKIIQVKYIERNEERPEMDEYDSHGICEPCMEKFFRNRQKPAV